MVQHPNWPPEASAENAYDSEGHGTNTRDRVAGALLPLLLALALPIAEGEIVAHAFIGLLPHSGFGGETQLNKYGDALFSYGFYLPFLVFMAPWTVLAVLVWKRSHSMSLWLLLGTLLGIIWFLVRFSVLICENPGL